jgi:hypothetical protein
MWSSSTTTCFSPTWRCGNPAWPSCCPPCSVVFDEAHQLNETGCSFSGAAAGHRPDASTSRATCWLPGCSRRAAWRTGSNWRQRRARGPRPAHGRGPAAPAPGCAGRTARPSRLTPSLGPGLARWSRQLHGRHERAGHVSEHGPDFERCMSARPAGQRAASFRGARARRLRPLGRRGRPIAADRVAAGHRQAVQEKIAPRPCRATGKPPRARLDLHVRHAGRRRRAALVHRALRPGRRARCLRVDSPFDYPPGQRVCAPRPCPPADPAIAPRWRAWWNALAARSGRAHHGAHHHAAGLRGISEAAARALSAGSAPDIEVLVQGQGPSAS